MGAIVAILETQREPVSKILKEQEKDNIYLHYQVPLNPAPLHLSSMIQVK